MHEFQMQAMRNVAPAVQFRAVAARLVNNTRHTQTPLILSRHTTHTQIHRVTHPPHPPPPPPPLPFKADRPSNREELKSPENHTQRIS